MEYIVLFMMLPVFWGMLGEEGAKMIMTPILWISMIIIWPICFLILLPSMLKEKLTGFRQSLNANNRSFADFILGRW